MPKAKSEPTYQHHKGSGQARTIIDGKTHYLGVYNSPQSQEKFAELLADWRLRKDVNRHKLTVDDLVIKFLEHAEAYYRHPDGTPTGTAENFRSALRSLVAVHGRTRVIAFGPIALREVREQMIKSRKARTHINGMISKIRQVFGWAVEHELIPAANHDALQRLPGLRAGRSAAKESDPVLPVDEGTVNDTLPHLPRVVADMVRLQLLTGARPGEVCAMRPCDITRGTSGVWTYRPASHKTAYRGRERRIFIGPEGQAILTPYLERDSEAICFSPADAEAERSASRRENRVTPMTPSQAAREPIGREFRDHYRKDAYCRAITRACEVAFGMPTKLRDVHNTVKRMKGITDAERQALKNKLNTEAAQWRAKHCWSPNQLRHSRATAIREQFGIEAAQTVLGHSDPKITLVYAERDFEMAARIMREIG